MGMLDFSEFLITKVFVGPISERVIIRLSDDEDNEKLLMFTKEQFKLIKEAIVRERGTSR